mgnify:CR=1 FL=1
MCPCMMAFHYTLYIVNYTLFIIHYTLNYGESYY